VKRFCFLGITRSASRQNTNQEALAFRGLQLHYSCSDRAKSAGKMEFGAFVEKGPVDMDFSFFSSRF
jgi:hypothetical protein